MTYLPIILHGLLYTLEFSAAAIILEIIFGLIAALMRLSKVLPLRWLGTVYVEIFRSTPLLVQLFFVVFGIPLVFGSLYQTVGQIAYPILAGGLTLALNEGAYVTEIVRAGILGVDRGQKEAAASIGMTGSQTMRYIVLPQAFKRMIPPLVNQSAQTIKDTTLLAPVGILEMMYQTEIIVNKTFDAFTFYGIAAIIYFIVIFAVSKTSAYLERRMQVDKR